MKKWVFILGVLVGTGCGGSEETNLSIPGIGLDPDQSVNEAVEYRLLFLGTGCEADLFSTTVTISQNGEDLSVDTADRVVATATIDSSGNVEAVLISPNPSFEDLSCSGLYNEGVFDMTCPLEGGTCDFLYVRQDVEVEFTR